jgi:hypothetical protein
MRGRYLMFASGVSDQIGTAAQASNARKITAPRRAPNQPGTAFSKVASSIDQVDWNYENNELDY